MDSGGQTPEELETLLEDAFLLRDADAVAGLFEDGSLLVTGDASLLVRGREEILQVASLLCQNGHGYLADPRRVFQARDTTLLIGDGVLNVARRGQDGTWRFAISMFHSSGEERTGPFWGSNAPSATSTPGRTASLALTR